MSTLVLGIGNPILGDDGAGIEIARRLKERAPDVAVEETNEAAISLLDLITGYDKLIIIDSIKTGKGKPGELYKLSLEDLGVNLDCASFHGMDIATAFEVGESLGCDMPRSVSIYAVEVKDNSNFAEGCTPEVAGRIPLAVQQIIGEEKL
ncbi:MAG: hydrogenase maturation protease [Dehalococcoidales bacterium]|jgi:hydrogenase maturation protease|nr:hydrogenase maturation protease [Dehalococcoidales bacterium]